MSYVRTPRVLDRHCHYPNKQHEYIQAQFLPQALCTTLMQVGEVREREDLKQHIASKSAEGQCL